TISCAGNTLPPKLLRISTGKEKRRGRGFSVGKLGVSRLLWRLAQDDEPSGVVFVITGQNEQFAETNLLSFSDGQLAFAVELHFNGRAAKVLDFNFAIVTHFDPLGRPNRDRKILSLDLEVILPFENLTKLFRHAGVHLFQLRVIGFFIVRAPNKLGLQVKVGRTGPHEERGSAEQYSSSQVPYSSERNELFHAGRILPKESVDA